jgi:hypothetical protein
MKKKIIQLTTAMVMTVSVMFAQDVKPIPSYVVKELETEFSNVSNLQWKTVDQFYKATFITDGRQLEVFYTFDGTLAAVSRRLTVDQLPLALIKQLKEKTTNHGVSDLFELLTDNGTEYFVTISNQKETKKFRSEGSTWTRY